MPNTRHALALALSLAAVGASAAPALAGPAGDPSIKMRIPDVPIAAGVIEHTQIESCWQGDARYAAIAGAASGCVVADTWAARERDRDVTRDRATGALRGETATVDGTIFSWTSKDDALVVGRGKPGRASTLSFAAETGMWQDTVARGWYRQTGESVRDGRTVVEYVETDAAPPTYGDAWLVVDKETGAVVERRYTSLGHSATQRVLVRETLPRTAATERLLVMGDHAGAQVREVSGEEATIAKAARKALKARTRAKLAKKLEARR